MRTPRRRITPLVIRSPIAPGREMHPSQFEINQCWLVVKASEAPLPVDEGYIEVYVLQDAASMYLFGNVFAPSGGGIAPEEEVNSLFQGAWRKKQAWPKRLLLPDTIPSRNSFAVVAKRIGIPVEVVPEPALGTFINDVQAAFREYFSGEGTSGA